MFQWLSNFTKFRTSSVIIFLLLYIFFFRKQKGERLRPVNTALSTTSLLSSWILFLRFYNTFPWSKIVQKRRTMTCRIGHIWYGTWKSFILSFNFFFRALWWEAEKTMIMFQEHVLSWVAMNWYDDYKHNGNTHAVRAILDRSTPVPFSQPGLFLLAKFYRRIRESIDSRYYEFSGIDTFKHEL